MRGINLKKILSIILVFTVLLVCISGCRATDKTALQQNESIITNEASSTNEANSTSESSKASDVEGQKQSSNKDMLKSFRDYYDKKNVTAFSSNRGLENGAKAIKLKNGGTIFDNGVYLRFDNYNGNGKIYGDVNTLVAHTYQNYKGTSLTSDYIQIGEETVGFEYPLGISHGESLRSVLELLGVVDIYSGNYKKPDGSGYNRDANPITFFESKDKNESLILSYHVPKIGGLPFDKTIDNGFVTITYLLKSKITIGGTEGTRTKTVSLRFTNGILRHLNISCEDSCKADYNYDADKYSYFYFDNHDYQYRKEKGVYFKITSIAVNNKGFILTYKVYADEEIMQSLEGDIYDKDAMPFDCFREDCVFCIQTEREFTTTYNFVSTNERDYYFIHGSVASIPFTIYTNISMITEQSRQYE